MACAESFVLFTFHRKPVCSKGMEKSACYEPIGLELDHTERLIHDVKCPVALKLFERLKRIKYSYIGKQLSAGSDAELLGVCLSS